MAIVQVTIVLREKLEEIGVEVSVETFEESQGIAGLGDDPFVSCTMVHVVRLVVLATHFVRVDLVEGQQATHSGAYVCPQEQLSNRNTFSLISRPSLTPIYLPVCKYGEGCLQVPGQEFGGLAPRFRHLCGEGCLLSVYLTSSHMTRSHLYWHTGSDQIYHLLTLINVLPSSFDTYLVLFPGLHCLLHP